MTNIKIGQILIICCLLTIHIQASDLADQYQYFQDQTSPRSNTLFDDADDIQRQLDNEAQDRLKFGSPKTIWVYTLPKFSNHKILNLPQSLERSPASQTNTVERETTNDAVTITTPLSPLLTNSRDWDYNLQDKWVLEFPSCNGRLQSPVGLPASGLVKVTGARHLLFQNFDVLPTNMTLNNDGKRILLCGTWPKDNVPLIYGGALHGRRYLFNSLVVHWPSEHMVSGLQYPVETQAFFVSVEYDSFCDALNANERDQQAILGVSSLYKFKNITHDGLADILGIGKSMGRGSQNLSPKPLEHFLPPFKEYVVYQGSLTVPPCVESVLWLVRARALPIKRNELALTQLVMPTSETGKIHIRLPQPLNDRRVFFFDNSS